MTNKTIRRIAELAEESLPFGNIHVDDISPVHGKPLMYAEAEITPHITMWWIKENNKPFKLVASPDLSEELRNELLHISNIRKEKAKAILKKDCDNRWSYAE